MENCLECKELTGGLCKKCFDTKHRCQCKNPVTKGNIFPAYCLVCGKIFTNSKEE